MSGKKVFPVNMIRVCVDAVANGTASGRAYSKMSESAFCFESLTELLLKLDKFFDVCRYPQNFQERRSFTAGEAHRSSSPQPRFLLDDEVLFGSHGQKCTMDIIVQSRRHSGWQGLLSVSSDPAGHVAFRSELELLDAMHKFLEAPETEQSE